ncbi:hypothetical protein [Solilutibacter silvestris]|uniref:hypothetical protein n=1 Tax=Solilutibacter silvestris TaxID=1645665 RepID=UPI003D34C9EC
MRRTYHLRHLLPAAAIGVIFLAGTTVQAAQPADKAAAKAAKREAFLRGDASSKGKRLVMPRTETEAVAAKRVLPAGIVEIPVPEDRLMNVYAVKRADGTYTTSHDEKPVAPVRKEAIK